jgi:hypothetical protein
MEAQFFTADGLTKKYWNDFLKNCLILLEVNLGLHKKARARDSARDWLGLELI